MNQRKRGRRSKANFADEPVKINTGYPESRLFVDPLDTTDQVQGMYVVQQLNLNIGNPVGGTIYAKRLESYAFTRYLTALTNNVRFDVSGIFDLTKFNDMLKHVTNALAAYVFYSEQIAACNNPKLMNPSLLARRYKTYGPETIEALNILKNRLETLFLPVAMQDYVTWMFKIYKHGDFPSGTLCQLAPYLDAALSDLDADADVATDIRTAIDGITVADTRVSGLIAKLDGIEQIKVINFMTHEGQVYSDPDFTAIWANFGAQDTDVLNTRKPLNGEHLHLFSNNPSIKISGGLTYYLTSTWQPGLVSVIDDTALYYAAAESEFAVKVGTFVGLPPASARNLAIRFKRAPYHGVDETGNDWSTFMQDSQIVTRYEVVNSDPDLSELIKKIFMFDVI